MAHQNKESNRKMKKDENSSCFSPRPVDNGGMNAAQMNGKYGQYQVYRLLMVHGRKCQMARYNESFDMLIDDTHRIEVKTCPSTRKDGKWLANIHRHGVLNENGTDAYIFRLEGVPGTTAALHLLMTAPLKKHCLVFSVRSLLYKYPNAALDFLHFAKTGELPRQKA